MYSPSVRSRSRWVLPWKFQWGEGWKVGNLCLGGCGVSVVSLSKIQRFLENFHPESWGDDTI